MARVELRHLYKTYDNGFEAVKDFDLDIKDREFVVFVGPSGCGKSTTLRMIAGLEEITDGELVVDGKRMNDVAASDRDIAMVFQNYALYPHMSVRKNIGYSLKVHHEKKDVINQKVQEAAEILGLEDVLDRKPGQLSGGQKQRVAMGRAIVRDPQIFLMDEPLSNLDAKLRGQMRVEITRMYQRLESTFIYVTHDQTEAMTLGTRIVVMSDGEIQQVDTPQRLFAYPDNLFVAGFIGSPAMNFIEGKIIETSDGLCVQTVNSDIPLIKEKEQNARQAGAIGKQVILGIRPEHISLARNENDFVCSEGNVDVYEILGSRAQIYISQKGSGEQIIADINADEPVTTGSWEKLAFDLNKIHVFDKETGVTITN